MYIYIERERDPRPRDQKKQEATFELSDLCLTALVPPFCVSPEKKTIKRKRKAPSKKQLGTTQFAYALTCAIPSHERIHRNKKEQKMEVRNTKENRNMLCTSVQPSPHLRASGQKDNNNDNDMNNNTTTTNNNNNNDNNNNNHDNHTIHNIHNNHNNHDEKYFIV